MEQMLETLRRYRMLELGEGVVVGVSGGPDSLALLHALLSLREEWQLRLVAVHVHHGLRGAEADGDADFVKGFCMSHEIPFYLFEMDIPAMAEASGASFEMEGRTARYEAFERVAAEEGCSKIAVAQNMNDQCETLLMRLFRGTGLKGLGGIKPVREGRIIRPLLEVSRAEIEAYCSAQGLVPRMDPTNAQPAYARNRIRLEVLPYLEAHFNPQVIQALSRTAAVLREDEALLERVALEALETRRLKSDGNGLEEGCGMDLNRFESLEPALQKRLVRQLAGEASGGVLTNFNQVHTEAVLELVSSREGSKVIRAGALEVRRVYDALWMRMADDSSREMKMDAGAVQGLSGVEAGWLIQVEMLTRDQWLAIRSQGHSGEAMDLEKPGIAVDLEKIQGRLHVRQRMPGDRFRPFGMKVSKKLKRFMIDEKIPEALRHKIPLICDENRIIWVYGYRMSEDVRVGPESVKIGWVTLRRNE